MRYPATIPALALAAGIGAGIFLVPGVSAADPYIPLTLFLIGIATFVARRDRATVVALVCGFAATGIALGRVADSAARNTTLRAFFDQHVRSGEHQVFANLEGRLRTDAAKAPSGVTLDVLVDAIELDGTVHSVTGGVFISVGGGLTDLRILQWRAGRRVAFPAALREPTYYRNPGVPDSRRLLAWRGVALVGSVKSDRLVEVTAHGSMIAEAAASIRAGVRRAVALTVEPWSARSAGVVTAILIGDRAGLDAAVERRLQEAGTYHVIAISGGNIAILVGLSVAMLRAVRAGPRASALIVIVLLGAYGAGVEGGPSVARATLMAVIYFAAGSYDHAPLPANVVALAAAILFCVDPVQVVDAASALTFGATIGILIGLSKIAPLSVSVARSPLMLLAASACAEVALLPVNAFVFSRVTFAGLLVNLAAIPLMTIVQISGMAAVALAAATPDTARLIGWIAHVSVEGLIGSAALVDYAPWLTRRLAPPMLSVVALYYASLVVAAAPMVARHGRRLRIAASATAATCGLWIVCAPAAPVPGRGAILRVTFLDVGQGDAALVQFPGGQALSIDAGGTSSTTFDIAGRVISPAFWALGIRRLQYMTVTHADNDHIGGAANLFRDFRPFEIWDAVPVPPHATTRELRALADHEGTAWRTIQPHDRLAFGQVEVIVHHPPRPDWERQRVRNDDSEVIEIRHGDVSFVFTGDIGRDVERQIVDGFDPAAIRILKVPHHGSATSSSAEFVDALRPDVAVISAGRGNIFGHPVSSVVQRYRDAAAAIYRTDQDGAVIVETDGVTVRVRTFLGRTLALTTHGRTPRSTN